MKDVTVLQYTAEQTLELRRSTPFLKSALCLHPITFNQSVMVQMYSLDSGQYFP